MSIGKTEREQKFEALYSRYADEVFGFIYARAGFDHAAAEDITQDVFTDVFRSLSGFRLESSERTWVFGVARHKLNDFYRKKYREPLETARLDGGEELDTAQTPDLWERLESQDVIACLNALPKQYGIALTQKYIDGASVKQIARAAGKSPKATESLLKRARNAFIKLYKEQEL